MPVDLAVTIIFVIIGFIQIIFLWIIDLIKEKGEKKVIEAKMKEFKLIAKGKDCPLCLKHMEYSDSLCSYCGTKVKNV